MNTKRKRKRTEDIDVVFNGGLAVGWAFDMPEEFKQILDIAYTKRIDKAKNAEKERELGHKLKNKEKIYRWVWTRGDPPAYSFAEGHVFYDPPGIRSMMWADALPILRRIVQVQRATPDPGALLVSGMTDDDAENPERTTAAVTGGPGWVTFEILYYQSGEIAQRQLKELTQTEFANFLRTGVL
jgi:hypothetical protein